MQDIPVEIEKSYISREHVLGSLAKWAIRQSPYTIPDNLAKVLTTIHESLAEDFPEEYMPFTVRELLPILSRKLREIPEYRAWNDRKNGNASPHKILTRYDEDGDPDDDFIDLDALERNAVNDI